MAELRARCRFILRACQTLQEFTFVFNTPGSVELRATATSAQANSVRTLTVDVNALGNMPPRIERLVASPTRGTAPFMVTLTFSTTDAEAETLSCSIDIGADGSDDQFVACGAGTAAVLVPAQGVVRLRLAVNDGRGGRATSDAEVEGLAANVGGGSSGSGTSGGTGGEWNGGRRH